MKYRMLLFPVFMLVGCAGLADYTITLENGYRIDRLSAHQIHIYGEEPVNDGDEHFSTYLYVPEKVEAIWTNDTHLVAKQLHLVSDERGYEAPPSDQAASKYSYWIIEMAQNKVTGPMTLEQLESQFEEEMSFTSIDDLERE